jgi:hypothetical protein
MPKDLLIVEQVGAARLKQDSPDHIKAIGTYSIETCVGFFALGKNGLTWSLLSNKSNF